MQPDIISGAEMPDKQKPSKLRMDAGLYFETFLAQAVITIPQTPNESCPLITLALPPSALTNRVVQWWLFLAGAVTDSPTINVSFLVSASRYILFG